MKKKKKLFESIGKAVYASPESEQFIYEFNDEAFDGKKKIVVKGKGTINCQVAVFLFDLLTSFNIPTWYFKLINDKEMLVRAMDMIPVEVKMYNIASCDFSARYGIKKGKLLSSPAMEFYLKNNELNNSLMSNSEVAALEIVSSIELKTIKRMTSKINAILKAFFLRRQLQLANFKLEFGRYKNKIVLGDAITLDTCQLFPLMASAPSADFAETDKKYEQLYEVIINKSI